MKISVVIPAYNEEKYIYTCLASLLHQTVQPDEIIVVNNNSKDRTVSIAKKFGVRIVNEEKQGMIFARNTGYDKAKYEIIARTDADTQPPPNWIEKIKKQFEKEEIDCLTGPVILYDLPFKSPLWSYAAVGTFRLLIGGKVLPYGPNHAITKAVWKKIRDKVCLDDKQVHEDFDIGLTIYKMGGKVKYDSKLIMPISGRRVVKKPESFFVEYPYRALKTFWYHRRNPVTSSRHS